MTTRIWPDDCSPISAFLQPVLNAARKGDTELADAVCEVAEALAAKGAIFTDRRGRPAHGVTDEQAVVSILGTYATGIARLGHIDDLDEVGALMRRVHAIGQGPRSRRPVG